LCRHRSVRRSRLRPQPRSLAADAGDHRWRSCRHGRPRHRVGLEPGVELPAVAPADAAGDVDCRAGRGRGCGARRRHRQRPGRWATNTPVPTGGSWKSIVLLLRGDIVAAAPVAMPDDPDYSQAAIPLASNRTAPMAPASSLLMRESHGGTALPEILAYTAFGL